MPTLEMRGRLNRPSNPSHYAWSTGAGIQVEVADRDVVVRWHDADDEPDRWGQMQAEVEAPLLAATLASGELAKVEWTRREVQDGGAKRIVADFRTDAMVVHALGRLDLRIPEQEVLAKNMALYVAAEIFKLGLEQMLADDLASAMRSFYVAAEVIVDHLWGSSREDDWRRAAEDIGVETDRLLHLYFSLQFARHADPSRARKRLIELGLGEPLSAAHCRGLTGELLRAYARRVAREETSDLEGMSEEP